MANGFKLSGGSYVRKNGNNSNSGLTDALPKATITAGLGVGSGDCVVLAGCYKESLSTSRRLVGDGMVYLDGGNIRTLSVSLSNADAFLNFYILNYTSINSLGNYNNCYLKNLTFNFVANNSTQSFLNSVFINVTILPVTSGTAFFTRNISINTIVNLSTQTMNLSSNYIDISAECFCNTNPSTFVNNNFRGKYTKLGISYCVPTGADVAGVIAGTLPFASRTETSYPSGCTDWLHVGLGQTATQCYVTNGNFNADPQFVDAFNEDFSVYPTSPMIGRGTGGTNIGNVKVTNTSLRKTATQFTSKNNLSGTSDLSVEPSNTTGEWLSEVITIDALNPRVFMRPTYVGNLSFEKGQTGNTANINDNVPWVASYTKNGTTITNTSPRPCVLVRFSNKNSMPNPAVDSDWDNGNNNTTTVNGVLPGEYFLAELNADFKYDANGFGNADTNFNVLVNSQLAAKYCMYKVILTDLY